MSQDPRVKENMDAVEVPGRGRMTIGCTIWMDFDMYKELGLVAAYERKKRGPLMRDIVVEKLRCYERNPAFKAFLKKLRDMEEEKKRHRRGKG